MGRATIFSATAAFGAACFLAQAVAAQDTLTPAIWIDPDGCEHWVIDDGAEGYMSPHLNRDGTPVCHRKDLCGVLDNDILFQFDSAEVTKEGRRRITRLFSESPARAYIVAGHSDDSGPFEYNLELSTERAQAVAALAREFGAPISSVDGFGERFPVAANDTEDGRRQNRRVELICLR